MHPFTTIAQALHWAADRLHTASPTARLDAQLLLAHALGWSRARVLAEWRYLIPPDQRDMFATLVERRATLEPIAYIVGHREFYGLDFMVDRRVLVPRPETELLVDLALAFARRRMAGSATPTLPWPTVADVGTGSGCIAVAVAARQPTARVYAIDRSPDALAVARQNATSNGVADRVTLIEGDLLDSLPEPVDLLLSNPPYTVLSEVEEGVRRHEPRLALDGGPDGLAIVRRLLARAPSRLHPRAAVILEISATQAAAVTAIARSHFPTAQIQVHQDLAGLDRVVMIETEPGWGV